ncbi:hypothetical protein Bbelb_193630 [Branchiostoma belcheri]|nr:hypothetical protein Bbelb_193630 [Branchiostoma belcheri]
MVSRTTPFVKGDQCRGHSPGRCRKLSEVVRSYDVNLTSDTHPEYQGEWHEVKIKLRHTFKTFTWRFDHSRYYRSGRKLTRIVASLWIIKDNVVGQLRTTSDTCHPTLQVSEVSVTSRNFRQLRTTSDTCHPTPQVSEVTVTSRNFRQLRTPATLPHKCRKLQSVKGSQTISTGQTISTASAAGPGVVSTRPSMTDHLPRPATFFLGPISTIYSSCKGVWWRLALVIVWLHCCVWDESSSHRAHSVSQAEVARTALTGQSLSHCPLRHHGLVGRASNIATNSLVEGGITVIETTSLGVFLDLQLLYLGYNNLSHVKKDWFSTLRRPDALVVLSLSHNKIVDIEKRVRLQDRDNTSYDVAKRFSDRRTSAYQSPRRVSVSTVESGGQNMAARVGWRVRLQDRDNFSYDVAKRFSDRRTSAYQSPRRVSVSRSNNRAYQSHWKWGKVSIHKYWNQEIPFSEETTTGFKRVKPGRRHSL